MAKFLIVGLGNIGDEYAETRHNIGFKIAEKLVSEAGGIFSSGRYADVAEVKHKGKSLVVLKPTTYMNLSGKAVNYWLQAEKIKVEHMMVLVDELALPFGKIRIGPKGSDGGHNGLKSIQETIGTNQYPRLRFGISNEFNKGAQVNYVLGTWNDEELITLQDRVHVAAESVRAFTFMGLERCMNQYNTK
ncbi:MAG: aminoacyl-tRNA hydrolase [bacterium]|nr:aminoacyl-tRNA hydrolase [bacterium]